MIFATDKSERRAAVRAAVAGGRAVNGIDYVEVAIGSGDLLRRTLVVHFVTTLTGSVPPPASWTITGGERFSDVEVVSAEPTSDPAAIRLLTDEIGDFSWYTLTLTETVDTTTDPAVNFDPALASVAFTFRPGCGIDLDCLDTEQPSPPAGPTIDVDYSAKDYSAFRRVLVDRMTSLQPGWTDVEAADIRTVLVEAMAYAADRLSYMQDVVATEGYLGTARQRVSLRRHARLVDYIVDEGCSARAFVRLLVSGSTDGPAVGTRLISGADATAPTVAAFSQQERTLRISGALVYEISETVDTLTQSHNAMQFYTWSGAASELPAGAIAATLTDAKPDLVAGNLLMLTSTQPGGTDPDPASPLVHPVRLTAARADVDPVTGDQITWIEWGADDALPFDLPLTQPAGFDESGQPVGSVSVAIALGNIVVAEHGERVRDPDGSIARELLGWRAGDDRPREGRPSAYNPALSRSPVSWRAPMPTAGTAAAALTAWQSSQTAPVIDLSGDWSVVPDLLASDSADADAALEVDDLGVGRLRFGDGVNGRLPDPFEVVTASYAVGLGTIGNVGTDAISRVIVDDTLADLAGALTRVTNPMPAFGGRDPEPDEQIRQRAPYAHLSQLRCITADDYAARAGLFPGVQAAFAELRWTGSWQTVVVYVDRIGGASVDADDFAAGLAAYLDTYRLIGQDIEIRDPVEVPLDMRFEVALATGASWAEVRARLDILFSSQTLPDGSLGLFHPDRLTFGTPIDTGPLIAAAQNVPGVAWTDIADIHALGTGTPMTVELGRIVLDPPYVPCLDNDPSRPDRGTVRFGVVLPL